MDYKKANMAARYEHEIPEGYEARIDGNKVIVELKESEDEKIRTRLIALVEAFGQGTYKNEMLAYLEKQKEQKTAKKDEIGYDLGREQGMDAGIEYVLNHLELYGLCKPTEWSEEDEDMLNSIIATCQLAAQDSDSERARHLLEMQERFLKSLRPQPKQEWSEEDEDELNNILAFVKNDIPISGDTRREFYNWLKSIKNRGNSPKSNTNSSYWKPSKEQMKALNEVANNGVLLDLFNDLLKLL